MVDKCEIKVPKSRNYLTEWPFVPWRFVRVAFCPDPLYRQCSSPRSSRHWSRSRTSILPIHVLQADFQLFIGGVQASPAYCFPAALQLPLCGGPSATPAVCISDTSLYWDGRAKSTDGHSVCSRWRRPVCPRLARPVRSIWYRGPWHPADSA